MDLLLSIQTSWVGVDVCLVIFKTNTKICLTLFNAGLSVVGEIGGVVVTTHTGRITIEFVDKFVQTNFEDSQTRYLQCKQTQTRWASCSKWCKCSVKEGSTVNNRILAGNRKALIVGVDHINCMQHTDEYCWMPIRHTDICSTQAWHTNQLRCYFRSTNNRTCKEHANYRFKS